MNKVLIGSVAALLSFGVVACGSDKKAADGALGAKQQVVFDKTVGQLKAAGITADEACMKNLIGQLSDADADLIAASAPPDTVTASPAGEAIGKKMQGCLTASTDTVATPTT